MSTRASLQGFGYNICSRTRRSGFKSHPNPKNLTMSSQVKSQVIFVQVKSSRKSTKLVTRVWLESKSPTRVNKSAIFPGRASVAKTGSSLTKSGVLATCYKSDISSQQCKNTASPNFDEIKFCCVDSLLSASVANLYCTSSLHTFFAKTLPLRLPEKMFYLILDRVFHYSHVIVWCRVNDSIFLKVSHAKTFWVTQV